MCVPRHESDTTLAKAFLWLYMYWFVTQADPAVSPLLSGFGLVSYIIQDRIVLSKNGVFIEPDLPEP